MFSIPLWWELSLRVSVVVQCKVEQKQNVGVEVGVASRALVRVGWEARYLEKEDGCMLFPQGGGSFVDMK